MRLSSIFILPNELTYIFGENHNGITLNLGDKFDYEVRLKFNKLSLLKNENKNLSKKIECYSQMRMAFFIFSIKLKNPLYVCKKY